MSDEAAETALHAQHPDDGIGERRAEQSGEHELRVVDHGHADPDSSD